LVGIGIHLFGAALLISTTPKGVIEMNMEDWTSVALRSLLVGFFATTAFSSANAVIACGGVQYPSCSVCITPWLAATDDHGDCVSCPGICYTRAETKATDIAGDTARSAQAPQFRRVTQQNLIDADVSLLRQIAQSNPGAAIVLDMFSVRHEMTYASIMQGQVASKGMPTTTTLELRMSPSPDDKAIKGSLGTLSTPGQYVETQWTSVIEESGNLDVTFETRVMNRDGSVERTAYPSIVATLQNAMPTRVVAWRVVN
jgi:hypothetical protein